jgi:hypothetical protein
MTELDDETIGHRQWKFYPESADLARKDQIENQKTAGNQSRPETMVEKICVDWLE